MGDRRRWDTFPHEAKVEKFYGTGIDGFHEYHNGYLNFGLWEKIGMNYQEAAENLIKMTGHRMRLCPKSRLLDVGCGMGTQDIFLTETFRPYSIDALDVTWKHIERARERAKMAAIDETRLRFHHGTATKTSFPDNEFTHVLSVEAPEHFDTREDFFQEALRVLAPGGVLVFTDYGLGRKPKNRFEETLVDLTGRLWQVPKANIYGNKVFEKKLLKAGFRNILIQDISEKVIPGYYHEHRRWESMRKMMKIRGLWKGILAGFLIDWFVYTAYRKGLCEYIVVYAEKPR